MFAGRTRWLLGAFLVTTLGVQAPVSAQPETGASEASRQLTAANGFLRRGLHDLAIDEYRAFLESRPALEDEQMARYGLGVAYSRTGNPAQAIEQLIRLRGESDFTFHAESLLLLCQSQVATGDFDAAAASAAKFLEAHEDHALAGASAAMLVESLHRSGRHDEAAESFRDHRRTIRSPERLERAAYFCAASFIALERFDDVMRALSVRGLPEGDSPLAGRRALLEAQAHQALGDQDEALEAFSRAIASGDAAAVSEGRVGLAFMRLQAGDARNAGQLIARLERDDPERAYSPPVRLMAARIRFELGEIEDAARICDRLLSDEETATSDAAYLRARCHMALGEAEEAAMLLDGADIDAESSLGAQMTYELAIAQWRAGQARVALGTIRDVNRDELPGNLSGDALFFEASLASEVESRASAAEISREFVKEHSGHPDEAAAWFLIGEHHYFEGDLEDARRAFVNARSRNPDPDTSRDAIFRLGQIAAETGDNDAAEELLEELIDDGSLEVEHASALETLGDVAVEQGDWAQAKTAFARRLRLPTDAESEARLHLKLGIAHARSSEQQEALAQFEHVLRGEGAIEDRRHALFESGQAHLAMGRNDQAQRAFKRVLDEAPDSRFAKYARRHLATIALSEGSFEDANELLESDGDVDAGVWFDRAQALMAMERFEEAEDALVAALTGDLDQKSIAGARAQLVVALARQEKTREAKRAFRKIDDSDWRVMDETIAHAARLEHAEIVRASGDVSEARELLVQQLSDGPPAELRPFVALELADVHAERDEHERVVALLEELVGGQSARSQALTPELEAQALYQLATSQYQLERFDDAARNFDLYINLAPESDVLESATHLAGESHFRAGRPEVAAERLGTVVDAFERSSRTSSALLRLGEALALVHRWEESERRLMQHRNAYPDDGLWFQAQFGIGWAREQSGRPVEAIEAYRPVADGHSGETAARAQFQIGECLYAQGQHEEAVREFLKVDILFAYPRWSAAALYEAGRCQEELRQMDDARDSYERVLEIDSESEWARMASARLAALQPSPVPGR